MVRTTSPLLTLALMLAMVLAAAIPALAQAGADQYDPAGPETVKVAFELTIDGEVPEGRTLTLNFPRKVDIGGVFCTTMSDPEIPRCVDGATYTAIIGSIGGFTSSTFQTTTGEPLSYEYQVWSVDGTLLETFAAQTITPTQDTTVSATYHAAGTTDPPPGETSTLSFELRAECRPPTGTDLLGAATLDLGDVGPVEWVRLTDPNGDGTYSGSMEVPTGVLASVWMAQGVERQDGREGPIPGESYAVIEHFGMMTLEEDKTFTASVSFCDGGGSEQYGGGQYDLVSGGTVSSPSSGNDTGLAQLPATGGALLTLGTGALLVGGGLLIRKIFQ